MGQSHLAILQLQADRKPDNSVQAMFSTNPGRKALVFVHGFSGRAVETWSDFHLLIPQSDKFADFDLYFYGYDGLWSELHASAGMLRDFLDRLLNENPQLVNASLPAAASRPDDFCYEQVVLVAHSLGAVICRRALVDATKMQLPWPTRIRMLFFAPAHRGAKVADLALEAASFFSFLKFFGVFSRFSSPLIDQLKPDSTELETLLAETVELCQDGDNRHLVAHKVWIAEYERIVKNETFGIDPPPETIPDSDHLSICKPHQGFRIPLACLEECL